MQRIKDFFLSLNIGHRWERLARLPGIDVLDCKCGARRLVLRGTVERRVFLSRTDPRARNNFLIDRMQFNSVPGSPFSINAAPPKTLLDSEERTTNGTLELDQHLVDASSRR